METRHTYHGQHAPVAYGRPTAPPGTYGVSGAALRGLGLGAVDPAAVGNAAIAGAYGLATMTGSAAYGALIGGLSAKSWEGAGTGALFSSGLSGLATGVSLTLLPFVGEPGYSKSLVWSGVALTALGAGAIVWGGVRYAR